MTAGSRRPLLLSVSLFVVLAAAGCPAPEEGPPDEAGADAGDERVDLRPGPPDLTEIIRPATCPSTPPAERSSCDTDDVCPYQYTSTCAGSCYCQAGYGWNCSLTYTPACAESLCPAQPVHGESCTRPDFFCDAASPSECRAPRCNSGSDDCPSPCYCDSSTSTWYCAVSAGPLCPSPLCPAEPPLFSSEHGSQACAPAVTEDRVCVYAHQLAEGSCSAECRCQASGDWSCVTPCECPAAAPVDGASCPVEAYGHLCPYGTRACECTGFAVGETYWDCYEGGGYPKAIPADGDACQPEVTRDRCFFATVPTCYACDCEASGQWSCGDSTCADCPATVPQPGTSCTAHNGQTCPYKNNDSSTTQCSCSGLWWTCTD